MGKRFFQSYRWVLLSMLVTILVLAAAAGYTIGVVSKNQAVSQIDVNIGSVEAYLQKNENQASQLTEELKEDYISKTRTTAMILSEDASFLTDDRTLEELRVTVNADRISVSDDRGNITASTDPSGEGSTVREEFLSHLSDNVYTDVLFLLDSDSPTIVAASTLGESGGLVQITFPAASTVNILQEADLANTASDMPLYASGETAIVQADTLEYISCTDPQKIGQKMAENLFQTRHKSGTLDVKTDDGAAAMLRYQTSGDYVIFATVPYSDIYHMRNVVVGWIAAGGVLMAVVSCLSLRMLLLREEKKEK